MQILTDPRLGRTPVAASALSAFLPDQFSLDDHGFELLSKLEQKWPAFRLEALAESVDRQHQEMGLGVRHDSSLLQWCKKLGQRASAPPARPLEAAARLTARAAHSWVKSKLVAQSSNTESSESSSPFAEC